MGEQNEMDLSRIVYPERSILVFANFHMELFDRIFSKLEVINAMEYLDEVSRKYSIPRIYVNTMSGTASDITELGDYNAIKESRRRNRTAPKSMLDPELNRGFEKFATRPGDGIGCQSHDFFNCPDFTDALEKTGRSTVMIAGFFTELEVARTAVSCIDHGYYGVTISDATSTYSERIYYEALDLISQTTEVIDTRDLMKLWP